MDQTTDRGTVTDSYAEVASTPEGRRSLARARLRYEALEAIAIGMNHSGTNQNALAEKLGVSKGAVSQVLGGDRDLRLGTLSDYLHALGFCVDLLLVRTDLENEVRGPLPTFTLSAGARPPAYRVVRPGDARVA